MTRSRPLPAPPAGLWERPDMAKALADRDMGTVLKIYRQWTGASQPKIATTTGVPQSAISDILNGKRQVTALDMFERFATGLDIPRHLLGLAPGEPATAQVSTSAVGRSEPDRRTVVTAGVAFAVDTEIDEVTERMGLIASSNVDDGLLHQFDLSVDSVGHRYEASDARTVYPAALRQRRWVHRLLEGHQHPRQRGHLYVVGGKLSGLLGYLAFDAGNERVGHAYLNEAFSLARAAGDHDLAAWVRGTQSFLAYYAGRYQESLDLARDGQRHAKGGPQSIRLAISGEARTLGRLGDRAGVDDAVDRALKAHANVTDRDPVGVFLSFEPYSAARIAGNAASAYLAVGAVDRVREFTDQAVPVFAAAKSTASHALTLVDASTSYLTGPDPEPERAGVLVAEALAVGADLRSEVVSRRAADFLTAASSWADVPEIIAVSESLHGWRAAS